MATGEPNGAAVLRIAVEAVLHEIDSLISTASGRISALGNLLLSLIKDRVYAELLVAEHWRIDLLPFVREEGRLDFTHARRRLELELGVGAREIAHSQLVRGEREDFGPNADSGLGLLRLGDHVRVEKLVDERGSCLLVRATLMLTRTLICTHDLSQRLVYLPSIVSDALAEPRLKLIRTV